MTLLLSILTKLQKALMYSIAGFIAAWASELSFRLELMLGLCLLPFAFYFGKNPLEYALLIGSYGLIILVELLNTALEAVVDRMGMEYHPLAKLAKDCGSAAVLVSGILAAMVWLAVFLS